MSIFGKIVAVFCVPHMKQVNLSTDCQSQDYSTVDAVAKAPRSLRCVCKLLSLSLPLSAFLSADSADEEIDGEAGAGAAVALSSSFLICSFRQGPPANGSLHISAWDFCAGGEGGSPGGPREYTLRLSNSPDATAATTACSTRCAQVNFQ